MSTRSGQAAPSVVRRQFGTELKTMRERMKLSAEVVAGVLRNTSATVRRWERGQALPRFSELQQLFDLYRVREPEHRKLLVDLYQQDDSDVWCSTLKLPEVTSGLRGFEALAVAVDLFDPWTIPGPFQTEAYAGAVLRVLDPHLADEDCKRLVEMRTQRQQRVYEVDRPPMVRAVLSENALQPWNGEVVDILREQVRSIYSGPFGSKLRVLPTHRTLHEGTGGPLALYRYDARAPAVYTEGPVRNLYTEDHETVTRTRALFQRLWDAALTERESSKLILSVLKTL